MMETLSPVGDTLLLDIRRQLAARNAVEVHAFREITTDYQQCLSHLRELRVRACCFSIELVTPRQLLRHLIAIASDAQVMHAAGPERAAGQGSSGAQAREC